MTEGADRWARAMCPLQHLDGQGGKLVAGETVKVQVGKPGNYPCAGWGGGALGVGQEWMLQVTQSITPRCDQGLELGAVSQACPQGGERQ